MAGACIATVGGKSLAGSESSGFRLDKEFLDKLRVAFDDCDLDHQGTLDHCELYNLWKCVLPDMPERELRKLVDDIFPDLDPNGDMHVSWAEIEGYFFIDPSLWNEVDKMITKNVIRRSPTAKEALWYLVDIDAPLYTQLPFGLGLARQVCIAASNLTIFVSILNFVLESIESLGPEANEKTFFTVEAVCIAIFTAEFILRVVGSPTQRGLWTSFFTWIDLLAILPFYINQIFGAAAASTLVVLRVLRLFRLFRLLKLGRNFEVVEVLVIAITRTVYPLIVLMFGMNTIAVVLAASLIYAAERQETHLVDGKWVRNHNSAFADAGETIQYQSIPASMWWAWVTLTTVGYGDMYPSTGGGKAVAAVVMLTGLVLMAFPLTLLASSFAETLQELKEKKRAQQRSEALQTMMQQGPAVEDSPVHVGKSLDILSKFDNLAPPPAGNPGPAREEGGAGEGERRGSDAPLCMADVSEDGRAAGAVLPGRGSPLRLRSPPNSPPLQQDGEPAAGSHVFASVAPPAGTAVPQNDGARGASPANPLRADFIHRSALTARTPAPTGTSETRPASPSAHPKRMAEAIARLEDRMAQQEGALAELLELHRETRASTVRIERMVQRQVRQVAPLRGMGADVSSSPPPRQRASTPGGMGAAWAPTSRQPAPDPADGGVVTAAVSRIGAQSRQP